MAVYSIDENLTSVLLSSNAYLFYVSFAGLGLGLGLGLGSRELVLVLDLALLVLVLVLVLKELVIRNLLCFQA